MTAAARSESELERRYQIRIEVSGVVHVLDTHDASAWDDGWPVFSTHLEAHAQELVRGIAKRTVDGDGWIVRAWHGSTRDLGELRHKLGLAYDALLERLGRE